MEKDRTMRAIPSVAASAAIIALLSGCSADRDIPPAVERPELIWSGYPVEIDGQSVGATGIKLSLFKDPDEQSAGEVRYEITNGCIGSGKVKAGGEVSAYEVFQVCQPEDIALIGRLNMIAPSGLPAPAPARLTWTRDTAVLSSIRGEARFNSAGPRASTINP